MKNWIFLLFPLFLAAYEGQVETNKTVKPWFTGPLLATSGNVTGAGHINFEPYVFAFAKTSFYNNDWNSQAIETLWNVQFRTPFWVGLTDWADFRISPAWNWNHRDNQSQWNLGDWSASLSAQFVKDKPESWLPAIKLSVRETFPTGKYQNLNPAKLGTDGGGMGTYSTNIGLNVSKLLHIYDIHFLSLRWNAIYSVPNAKVHVKGFNAYGGGFGTDGTVTAEQSFTAIFAFEYNLSQNWVIACDFQGIISSKTTFEGHSGIAMGSDGNISPSGVPAINENMASIQYSIAPAIEYNWSDDLGMIAGVWLTLAGKNAPHFTTGVIALNYYH
jgi:hypothetical protein